MLYAKLSRNEQDLSRFNDKDLTADTRCFAFTAPSESVKFPKQPTVDEAITFTAVKRSNPRKITAQAPYSCHLPRPN